MRYEKDEGDSCFYVIIFNSIFKRAEVFYMEDNQEEGGIEIYKETLNAITQQMKELGWL